MKIGILGSSNDMLSIFQFAHRYNHEYVVWSDDASAFWGDLDLDLVLSRVKIGMDFLLSKGVDVVVLPPVIELAFLTGSVDYVSPIKVLPLFSTYVREYCLAFSLIGKVGFAGDWLDLAIGQKLLEKLASDIVLSDNQRAIKKFHFPFVWRGKNVRLWRVLLENLSWSAPLVNTLIKNDLKYFKDAAVDTLIPMNYSYFLAQKTISHLLNTKKIRFHTIDVLETVFAQLVPNQAASYGVSVFFTGHGEFLTKNKRLLRLLDKGTSGNLTIEKA